MHGLIREEYNFPASTKVLTRHIYSRMYCGKIVIIAENPSALLPPLRKQWLKLARKVQVERAKTLDGGRIKELTLIVATMQTMRFKAGWGDDPTGADVYVASIDQLMQWPPDCSTLYVTSIISKEQLHMVTSWMTRGSLVVIYR